MSRGGGGRGGRGRGGFGRGGGNLPFAVDPALVLDGKPSDVFPFYNVPRAPQISKKQEKQIAEILLFREQLHDSPLYTQAKQNHGEKLGRSYGQDQVNERYGQTSKATINPFLAVPSYSQRFRKAERTLPDLGSRPFAKEFFPLELHDTLDGDGGHANKRQKTGGVKKLALSNITSIKTAEELFLTETELQTIQNKDNDPGLKKALQLMESAEKRQDGEDGGMMSGDEDENLDDEDGEGQEEDEVYGDDVDSGDDYNAEQYFEENRGDEDYDEGGDDGADFL